MPSHWRNCAEFFPGEIRNWKQVGGRDEPIAVVTSPKGSGMRAAVQELISGEKSFTPAEVVSGVVGQADQQLSMFPTGMTAAIGPLEFSRSIFPRDAQHMKIRTKILLAMIAASVIPLVIVMGILGNTAAYDQDQQRVLVVTVFGMTIVNILAAFAMARAIVRPLREIVDNLREIADGGGDLSRELPVHSRDEIGELSEGFNRFLVRLREMVGRLRSVIAELGAANDTGPQFLA